jgi:hypothetical protein
MILYSHPLYERSRPGSACSSASAPSASSRSSKGRIAGVVRDDIHGAALGAAGVERVLNPFNDAADYAARAFAAEIAYEDAHRTDAPAAAGTQSATPAQDPAAAQPAASPRAHAPDRPQETER